MFYSDQTRQNALRVIQELPTKDVLQIIQSAMPNANKFLIKETQDSMEQDAQREKSMRPSIMESMKYQSLPEERNDQPGMLEAMGKSAFKQNVNESNVKKDGLTSVTQGAHQARKSNVQKIYHPDMSKPANDLYNAFISPISSDGEQPGNVTNE